MMLFTALFILSAVGAAFGEEDECNPQTWHDKCHTGNGPREIPETMEDLMNECRTLKVELECVQELAENCEEKPFRILSMKKMAQFMEKHCNEESPWYPALNENYQCIQPVAKNMGLKCRPSKKAFEEMVDSFQEEGDWKDTPIFCQLFLYETTCVAHMIGKECGEEAKHTVAGISQNITEVFEVCSEESTANKLQPMKKLFEEAFADASEE